MNSFSSADLVVHASTLLEQVSRRANQSQHAENRRYGGYLKVIDDGLFGPPIAYVRIGAIPEEGLIVCGESASEAASSLLNRPGEVSSWQSCNPSSGLRGGAAIRAGRVIIAFSGLSELGNEALCLAVAVACNLLSVDAARAIAQISSNQIALDILSTLRA